MDDCQLLSNPKRIWDFFFRRKWEQQSNLDNLNFKHSFDLLALFWFQSKKVNPNLVSFEVEWGETTPVFKLFRIMLETSILPRKYTPVCSFRKYTFQYPDSLNFAGVSIILNKKLACFVKIVPLPKAIVWELC